MSLVQRIVLSIVVVSAGVAGYIAWWTPAANVSQAPGSANEPTPTPSAHVPANPPPAPAPAAAPNSGSYRVTFDKSMNYYDFVRGASADARAGNPQAAFYISEALGYCNKHYKRYFAKDSNGLTPPVEDVVARFTQYYPAAGQPIRVMHERCHSLMENNVAQWGSSNAWLAAASAAGLPAAQAKAAELMVADQLADQQPPVEFQQHDPRALLRDALLTKDPTALFMAGALGALNERQSHTLNGNTLAEFTAPGGGLEDRLAWWLLACSRGYDCSENAPWYGLICASDMKCVSGETAADYITRTAQQYHYADLEERAKALDAKLDAGDWSALGLGDS